MKKVLVLFVACTLFVFGCSSECPYTPHPYLFPNSAPTLDGFFEIIQSWDDFRDVTTVFNHDDLYAVPIQSPIYSDVVGFTVTVKSRVFGKAIVFYRQIVLEAERDGEWASVFYAPPRFLIDMGWGVAGNPDDLNEYVNVDFHFMTFVNGRQTIYDRDVWSNGHMLPGNYRILAFVGPHTFYFPFEIIARP